MRRLREGVRIQVLAEGPPYADSRNCHYEKQEVRVTLLSLVSSSDSMTVVMRLCASETVVLVSYSYW